MPKTPAAKSAKLPRPSGAPRPIENLGNAGETHQQVDMKAAANGDAVAMIYPN